MSGIVYYICDLESNGLRVNYHEATEIGIVRAHDRVQLWRQIKCERPENSNFDALRITNKTLADLENGLTRAEVVEECDRFFNEDGLTPAHRCIVGHNIYSFDRRFLHALWESVGKIFPANLFLDTIPMVRHYAKQIGLVKPKVNLNASMEIVGIKKAAGMHNARSDSRNSYLLWKDLVENKKIDYLSFVKTFPHNPTPSTEEDEGGLDPALLDI